MAAPEIAVTGMKETRKALRDFGADNAWRAPLRDAYRGVGTLVEGDARRRASTARPTIAGSVATMGSRAVASIRGKGTTTGATLEAFKGIPYGAGWNFGTTGRFRQFPTRAEPDHALYAAVKDKREQITNEFAERIGDALERAFPE